MSRLTDNQRVILACSMSDASCGLVLGKSAAWVARMRREMGEAADVKDVQTAPTPQAEPEPPAVAVATAPPARPKAEVAARPALAAPVAGGERANGVRRLKAVSADIQRWAGWFLAARWPAEDVADLFGVHPDALIDLCGVA